MTVDDLQVYVHKTNRKSLELRVSEDGAIIVKVPTEATMETVVEFINKHREWIAKKRGTILKRDPKILSRRFLPGESFLYLGRYYRLKIVSNQSKPLIFKDGWFYLSESYVDQARDVFVSWYRQQAREIIKRRVKWYASLGGFEYKRVNITNARKRWGSCTREGTLNFSWRLIMAPLRAIDYVVIHELVHTIEPRHTKEFWAKVKVLMPDYENWKKWLDENGYLLTLII
ncbi:metal-dependent hydrolase [Thermococcus celericrescens]|uniref:Metal-dependent hydrolase n=1 Tax=Thermococcus celericrescens TaxID=227598 RepID=A0A100XYJ1_9EURY|nr:metal-dependent hydrolase [Thermococcus celericrescens]